MFSLSLKSACIDIQHHINDTLLKSSVLQGSKARFGYSEKAIFSISENEVHCRVLCFTLIKASTHTPHGESWCCDLPRLGC